MVARWCVPLLLAAACGGGGAMPPDAGAPPDGATHADASHAIDARIPLSWVDFTVSGCPAWDPSVPRCSGPAPLTLRFAAIAPAPIDSWLWLWGDSTADGTEATPEHRFELPGVYTVELRAGGPGGTASARKEMLVSVEPAPVGARCEAQAHCAPGFDCLCHGDPACPPSLAQGICSRPCGGGDVCDGGVCVDLAPAGGGGAPWRQPLCLAACAVDADCASGLVCRELRLRGGGWTAACFAPAAEALADDGASCVDAWGAPDSTACASGHCEAVGARGVCAATCDLDDPCPSYAACADVTSLGGRCLARCASRPCDGDPWLACEAPDASGSLGFTLVEPADPAGYCAPRRCAVAADCGMGGECLDLGGAWFCGAPP